MLTNTLGDYIILPNKLQHLFLMLLLIAIISISLPPATYIHNHVIGTQTTYQFPIVQLGMHAMTYRIR